MASQAVNASNPLNNISSVHKNAGNTAGTAVTNEVRIVGNNLPVSSQGIGVSLITGSALGSADDYQVLVDESPANAQRTISVNVSATGISLTPISSTGVFLRDGRHATSNLTQFLGSGFTPVTSLIGSDSAAYNPAYSYIRGAAPVQSGFY